MLDVNAYNISSKAKYLIVFPIELLNDEGYTVQEVPMNITQGRIPGINIPTSTVGINGQNIPVPNNKLEPEDYSATFTTLVSDSFIQYWFITQWQSKISNFNGQRGAPFNECTADISVYKLSSFKQIVCEFVFYNCWISNVGELTWDYTGGEEDETIEFTLTHAGFHINWNINF